MKPINDLTPDEVRREIAERLGWTDLKDITYWEEDYYDTREVKAIEAISPNGDPHFPDLLPDWPRDPGAALALCQEVGFRPNREWWLVIKPDTISPWYEAWFVDYDWQREGRWEVMHQHIVREYGRDMEGEAETLALALSRLALVALRQGGDDAR